MMSVRNKLGTISSLGLLLALVTVVSRTMPKGPPRHAQAQAEIIVVDYSSVVSQAPSGYGTNIWWTDEDADIWTARFAELSPSIVRLSLSHLIVEPVNDDGDPDHINWEGFLFDTSQPVPGAADRTFTIRDALEALRDQGFAVLIHFAYLSPWLSANSDQTYPPADLDEYAEFMTATLRYLVETLDYPPDRVLIEAMNEPDLGCGADPAVACFWYNWDMDDIADVVRVTHQAIEAVDPAIRLVGLAECCGTTHVRDLLDNYTEGAYLDGLSYHYYSPSGYNLNTALNRATALASYGLPIYLDEYGSFQYLSEGTDGGLWHSWALEVLWKAGLVPVQFSISENPYSSDPYYSMGLFRNWNEDWERKPSYWVYANFFHLVGSGEVISHTAPSGVDVLAVRQNRVCETSVILWVVYREDEPLVDYSFAVYNFPSQEAILSVYDNLVGSTPVLTTTVRGSPLVFTTTLPARSSQTFAIGADKACFDVYLPIILRGFVL